MSKILIPEPKITTFEGPRFFRKSIAWHPNGEQVVFGGLERHDGPFNSVHQICWYSLDGELISSIRGHRRGTNCLVFSPDGKWMVTSGEQSRKVYLYKTDNLDEPYKKLKGLGSEIHTAAFSSDSKRLAVGNRDFRILDMETLTKGVEFKDRIADDVSAMAFSLDGKKLAVGNFSGYVSIYDTENNRLLLRLNPKPRNVELLRFSPDGDRLSIGYADKECFLYKITDDSMKVIQTRLRHQIFKSMPEFIFASALISIRIMDINPTEFYFVEQETISTLKRTPLPSQFDDGIRMIRLSPKKDKILVVKKALDSRDNVCCILDFGRPIGVDPRLPGKFNPDVV